MGREVYSLEDADGLYGEIEIKVTTEDICTDADTVVKISIAVG